MEFVKTGNQEFDKIAGGFKRGGLTIINNNGHHDICANLLEDIFSYNSSQVYTYVYSLDSKKKIESEDLFNVNIIYRKNLDILMNEVIEPYRLFLFSLDIICKDTIESNIATVIDVDLTGNLFPFKEVIKSGNLNADYISLSVHPEIIFKDSENTSATLTWPDGQEYECGPLW